MKKYISLSCAFYLLCASVLFANNNLDSINDIIKKYGKKAVMEFITSESDGSEITVQVGDKLYKKSGRQSLEYITVHSVNYDFKRLQLSVVQAKSLIVEFIKNKEIASQKKKKENEIWDDHWEQQRVTNATQQREKKHTIVKKSNKTRTAKRSKYNNIFLLSKRHTAKADLKQELMKRYGNSYSAIEMLLNAGMKDYNTLCTIKNHKVSNGILIDLKNRYYPSFSAILMLYKSNIKSYNNLIDN